MAFLRLLAWLLPVGATAALTWIWIVQNAGETAHLQLDLGAAVGAWRTAEAVPVTSLVLWGFGGGFLLATLMFGGWGLGQAARARRAERANALNATDLYGGGYGGASGGDR